MWPLHPKDGQIGNAVSLTSLAYPILFVSRRLLAFDSFLSRADGAEELSCRDEGADL